MVEELIAADTVNTDSFEWIRQVRHYWDSDHDVLYVVFAQVSWVLYADMQVGSSVIVDKYEHLTFESHIFMSDALILYHDISIQHPCSLSS